MAETIAVMEVMRRTAHPLDVPGMSSDAEMVSVFRHIYNAMENMIVSMVQMKQNVVS